jgi:hypothetical protein
MRPSWTSLRSGTEVGGLVPPTSGSAVLSVVLRPYSGRMSSAVDLLRSWVADPSIVMDTVRVLGVAFAGHESDGTRYRVTVEHSIDGEVCEVAEITATVSGTVACCIGANAVDYVASHIEWRANNRQNDGGKLRWLQAAQPINVWGPRE